MTHTPAYKSWSSMMSRCNNPNAPDYCDYGGRGISVCERWRSFVSFYEDMGARPVGCTLDRKDPDAGYTPENCRWADARTQAQNKRGSRQRVLDQVDAAVDFVRRSDRPAYSAQNVVALLLQLRLRISGDGGRR
jgi:hypothetical protein